MLLIYVTFYSIIDDDIVLALVHIGSCDLAIRDHCLQDVATFFQNHTMSGVHR